MGRHSKAQAESAPETAAVLLVFTQSGATAPQYSDVMILHSHNTYDDCYIVIVYDTNI